jgi:hypothetical protein
MLGDHHRLERLDVVGQRIESAEGDTTRLQHTRQILRA